MKGCLGRADGIRYEVSSGEGRQLPQTSMISRLAYGPVALGLEIPAGEQTWLGSVPLELPGDVNRKRCGEEIPRSGRLREDMSERSRKKAGKKKRNATSVGERDAQSILRRPADPQRFCTQYEECMVSRPIGREVPPRHEGIRCAGW